MKPRLLFVMNHLDCGGAEKALVSLLQVIDYDQYEVDLLLFKREGMFLKHVPKQVKLLQPPADFHYYDMPIRSAIAKCIRKGSFRSVLPRLYLGLVMRTEDNAARREQLAWRHIVRTFKQLDGQYDAAIGFLEKTPIYYVIDKVKARRKIGWIHTNYANMGMDRRLDEPYFNRLDHIVTVSEECGYSVKDTFEEFKAKVKVIHNVVSPAIIRRLAQDELPAERSSAVRLLTIARLHHVKGIDLAIEAARLLREMGVDVDWTVLGEGSKEERESLTSLIERYGLQQHMRLIGAVDNPYPYLKLADIVVQPSRYEGKSIAIDEAKIMGKPIVATAFTTVADQIEHGKSGLVVEIQPQAIAGGIKLLIEHPELREAFAARLAEEALGTENEVRKLYELVHDGEWLEAN
ncbi:glycosyltransferase [Paenibacillus sp. 1011MAR3C5]|uniref:glycosyltransferase n=1 Tax=Paenibacillus sp. 1011MAR3C5 TaxID=1675787 RepID=UPI000E6CBC7E|nr:glycosyltransferase [Paenibacillus sp. 1011MAR3C5]RJE91148.1 glycosyltransferase [Paenibacillus sp. 1011MAR3C5]